MKSKILMYVLIAALTSSLGLLGKVGCDRIELQSVNDKLNKELMQANLKLGRAHTEFGNAEKHIDELEKEIQREINERDAVMTMYGKLKARYKVLARKKRGKITEIVYKDKIIKVTVAEDLDLIPGMHYEAIDTSLLKPVHSVSGEYTDHRLKLSIVLFPRKEKAKLQIDYELTLKLEAQFAETHLPSGAVNHYATVWEVDGKGNRTGKFNIESFKMIVRKPDAKRWFWWSPHVDVGGLGGAKLLRPDVFLGGSIGFSPFGYGLTINDLDWRFLRVSLDLSNNIPGVGISPALWNLGGPLPLLSNLWIGPHLTYLPPEGLALSLFIGAML